MNEGKKVRTPKPRINKALLLRNYQKEMKQRLAVMHSLAHDMCGSLQDVHEVRAELRQTNRLLLQLIALVEAV